TRFDQLHNLSVVGFYEINERWSLSSNFYVSTGTPTTFYSNRFEFQNYAVPYTNNAGRNNVRIPTYHRFDFSVTLNGKKIKNDKKRKNEDFWVFSFYNVYGRRNPFSIYFSQQDGRIPVGNPIITEAVRFSVFGSIIPSVSYNFKF
nr:hypothetical protein [Flammeovirgaceae bacterium]